MGTYFECDRKKSSRVVEVFYDSEKVILTSCSNETPLCHKSFAASHSLFLWILAQNFWVYSCDFNHRWSDQYFDSNCIWSTWLVRNWFRFCSNIDISGPDQLRTDLFGPLFVRSVFFISCFFAKLKIMFSRMTYFYDQSQLQFKNWQ